MTIYSTIWSDDRPFNAQVRVIDWRSSTLWQFERALLACRSDDVVIINGALGFADRWRDLASAVLARSTRRKFGLVVSDATWRPRSVPDESTAGPLWRANDALSRVMARRVAQERTVFCFLSRIEVEDFVQATDVDPAKAVYTPFMYTVDAAGVPEAASNHPRRRVVFTGGNTLRDWPYLCEALADIDAPVRVATRHTGRTWPSNFEVGPCSEQEFFRLAAQACVGVLALRSDIVRSCGQQTYLNLLRLGTPVVVNDAPGVHDHLDAVPGSFVVPSKDPGAMRSRVVSLLEADPAEVRALARTGQRLVTETFSPRVYLDRLVQLARTLESQAG